MSDDISFTKRQVEGYNFIKSFILNKKYSPSFDEIVSNTNLKSKQSVQALVIKLKKARLINYVEKQSRTISLNNSIVKIDKRKNDLIERRKK